MPNPPEQASNDLLTQIFEMLAQLPDLGRIQNEQLGDMEFAQAIAPYLDPQDRSLIRPEVVKLIGLTEPSTLHGTNTLRSTEPRERKIAPSLHPQGKDTITFDPGFVYALHAENANPALFAHEFRHGSSRVRGKRFERGQSTEQFNRFEDLYHAQTEQDKQEAIRMIADLFFRGFDKKTQSSAEALRAAKSLAPSIMQQMEVIHTTKTGTSVGEELMLLLESLRQDK